jgi:membrane protease YdiL (CAAX protease family)
MSLPAVEQQEPRRQAEPRSVPWSLADTWLGLGLFVLVLLGIVVLYAFIPPEGMAGSLSMAILEAVLVLPVAIVLGVRRIHWRHLGFRKFSPDGMAVGCGVAAIIYPLVLLHNLVLMLLGIDTQGDSLTALYEALQAPVPFLIAGAILAPLAEEIFFRGFLFAGLRQRHGWVKAMLISSAIFAAFHLQLQALIPTFLLGCALAFAYQRSNSLWPGILIHFLINGFALGITVLAFQMGWL